MTTNMRIRATTLTTAQQQLKRSKVYDVAYVYKLTCPDDPEIYIGSTARKLSQRFAEHKYEYQKARGNLSSRRIFENAQNIDDVTYEIIETVHRCTKDQLHAREHYHIRNTPNVINNIPAFTAHIPHVAHNDPLNFVQYLFVEVN